MKTFRLISFLLLLSFNSIAQTPHYSWARGIAGDGMDLPLSIAADQSGNSITLGHYRSDTLFFGGTYLLNSENISPSTFDVYLIKYDSLGTVLWSKTFGSSLSYDYANAVTTDNNNNIIITGNFIGSSLTIDGTTLPGSGSQTTFVAKFDPSGVLLWANQLTPSMGNTIPEGVAADPSGNIYITGTFDLYLVSGTDTITSNGGAVDAFIAKFDPIGALLWIKGAGGSIDDYSNTVSTDMSGNAIITGYFNDTITFGATTLSNTNPSTYDIFIAKYDPSGNVIWAKSVQSIDYNNWPKSAVDPDGNILLTGFFNTPSITFDTITLNNSNSGSFDSFIAKYDSTGNVMWVKGFGGSGDQSAQDVTTDTDGNIFISGGSDGGALTFDTLYYPNLDGNSMFVAKYDEMGNPLWANSVQAVVYPNKEGIAADPFGNVFITGILLYPSTIIGPDSIYNASSGAQDVFIARINAIAYPPCYSHYTASYDTTLHTFTLTVDPAATAIASNYYWDFGDSTSSTLATPSHFYAIDSVYYLCMTIYDIYGDSCTYCQDIGIDDSGNIIRTGGFNLVVVSGVSTSIGASEKEEHYNVFPNPTTGKFTFISASNDPVKVDVMNLLGQQVYSKENSEKRQIEFDLSDQPNGIYFLQIHSKGKSFTKKICISK